MTGFPVTFAHLCLVCSADFEPPAALLWVPPFFPAFSFPSFLLSAFMSHTLGLKPTRPAFSDSDAESPGSSLRLRGTIPVYNAAR